MELSRLDNSIFLWRKYFFVDHDLLNLFFYRTAIISYILRVFHKMMILQNSLSQKRHVEFLEHASSAINEIKKSIFAVTSPTSFHQRYSIHEVNLPHHSSFLRHRYYRCHPADNDYQQREHPT